MCQNHNEKMAKTKTQTQGFRLLPPGSVDDIFLTLFSKAWVKELG